MSAQHTPGRLEAQVIGMNQAYLVAKVFDIERVIASVRIGTTEGPHNLRRLAACWNACEGISAEELEIIADAGETFTTVRDRYIAQRDELLAALQAMADLHEPMLAHNPTLADSVKAKPEFRAYYAARAAIAKATGQEGSAA